MTNNNGILLVGLDGSNPLAYLAALGTLRTLTLALPDDNVRMDWTQHDGAWRPRIQCSLSPDADAIIAKLDELLSDATNRMCFAIGDNLNLPAPEFGSWLRKAIARPSELSDRNTRFDIDFLAAFGSEAVTNDDGTMQDTALRTMSGAGHQHFLKFFRELIANTHSDHLRRALLLKWDYADEGRGMNLRWDPLDDRRYALRWEDPSSDPVKTMRGANRLAIEAMPMLPTMPAISKLATTCFEGTGARSTFFTWPVWSVPISMEVTASLLGQGSNLPEQPESFQSMGICERFRSARITIGKFRNFTLGVSV